MSTSLLLIFLLGCLAASLAGPCAAQASERAEAADARSLRDAMVAGTPHLVVTDHLDLREWSRPGVSGLFAGLDWPVEGARGPLRPLPPGRVRSGGNGAAACAHMQRACAVCAMRQALRYGMRCSVTHCVSVSAAFAACTLVVWVRGVARRRQQAAADLAVLATRRPASGGP